MVLIDYSLNHWTIFFTNIFFDQLCFQIHKYANLQKIETASISEHQLAGPLRLGNAGVCNHTSSRGDGCSPWQILKGNLWETLSCCFPELGVVHRFPLKFMVSPIILLADSGIYWSIHGLTHWITTMGEQHTWEWITKMQIVEASLLIYPQKDHFKTTHHFRSIFGVGWVEQT